MANLWLEFGLDSEASSSTSSRCVRIATKTSFRPEEVLDLGPGARDPSRRFSISEKLLSTTSQTIQELQIFIERMSAIVPGRTRHFIVDLDDIILELLAGAESTGQLLAAWTALSSRVGSAQRFMLKYRDEFVGGATIIPASPASTSPELHQELSVQPSVDRKLRHLYDKFPRHNAALSISKLGELREGRAWNSFVTVPEWLEEQVKETERIAQAPFSSSIQPSYIEQPSETLSLLTPDVSARTSYRSGGNFVLPPITKDKGKATPSKKVTFEEENQSWPNNVSAVLASNTPYRENPFQQDSTAPVEQVEPGLGSNILFGLAAPKPPSFSTPGRSFDTGHFGLTKDTPGFEKIAPQEVGIREARSRKVRSRKIAINLMKGRMRRTDLIGPVEEVTIRQSPDNLPTGEIGIEHRIDPLLLQGLQSRLSEEEEEVHPSEEEDRRQDHRQGLHQDRPMEEEEELHLQGHHSVLPLRVKRMPQGLFLSRPTEPSFLP
ncbi:hypothetical protein M413DRAFT_33165 [Hebeloma cylindrosporum]|uniref:Uncharacterized protein n=1 Tax=Hebeloma cylindrosporum TaxID=76867 RepID=A0A0C3BRE0_HEBCY|nr:hypothetical protein M413DRAFT_33165 [Hebeloma cylindrosporum h7]